MYLPQLNGFQYSKWLDSSIWSMGGTLTGTTIQSGPGSNRNERVLQIPKSSRIGASSSDCLVFYPRQSFVLLLCRNAVGLFYSPNRLGCIKCLDTVWEIFISTNWNALKVFLVTTESNLKNSGNRKERLIETISDYAKITDQNKSNRKQSEKKNSPN